jgi:hypothetical protein
MKIYQLLSKLHLPVTNEENKFITKHQRVRISSLDERDQWVAQNLVRKGIYEISKDANTLIKVVNETDS